MMVIVVPDLLLFLPWLTVSLGQAYLYQHIAVWCHYFHNFINSEIVSLTQHHCSWLLMRCKHNCRHIIYRNPTVVEYGRSLGFLNQMRQKVEDAVAKTPLSEPVKNSASPDISTRSLAHFIVASF